MGGRSEKGGSSELADGDTPFSTPCPDPPPPSRSPRLLTTPSPVFQDPRCDERLRRNTFVVWLLARNTCGEPPIALILSVGCCPRRPKGSTVMGSTRIDRDSQAVRDPWNVRENMVDKCLGARVAVGGGGPEVPKSQLDERRVDALFCSTTRNRAIAEGHTPSRRIWLSMASAMMSGGP